MYKSLFLLSTLIPSVALALQWRTLDSDPEINAMRFGTINDAQDFVVAKRVEDTDDILLNTTLFPYEAYTDGRYVSKACFLHKEATGEYDPATCTGQPATVYSMSDQILPDLSLESPNENLLEDLGPPEGLMCTGNPINLATGNKFQAELDYQSGGADPLVFARYYNSLPKSLEIKISNGGSEGTKYVKMQVSSDNKRMTGEWRHSYSQWVDVNPDRYGENMLVVHRPEGQRELFYKTTEGWKPSWKSDVKLAKEPDGQWVYKNPNGVIERFYVSGDLKSITKPNGNVLNLTYSGDHIQSVSDSYGRTLTFTYDGDSISSITDPAGNAIQYRYDFYDRLSEVQYQNGAYRGYVYGSMGLLSGLIDENGNQYATWDYDSEGRAYLSEHAGGTDRSTVYYESDTVSTVTNALGHTQTYTYDYQNGSLKPSSIQGAPCDGFVGGTQYFEYDSDGQLTQTTDKNGQIRSFDYNDRGLQTYAIDENGGRVYTEWSTDGSWPTKITEPDRTTHYTYDSMGNLLTEKVVDNSTSETREWTYHYTIQANGLKLLTSIDGSRTDVSDVTTFQYDGNGNLRYVTNALGHTTEFADYNAHGRPMSIIHPNGMLETLTYDSRGRVTSSSNNQGYTTYHYDGVGQLTQVNLPSGAYFNYEYDASHRLVATVDSDSNRQEVDYNALGNPTAQRIVDAWGNTRWKTSSQFNEIGWLTSTADAYNNTTSFGYDVVANLTGETSPEGRTYTHQYDGFHNRTSTTDPAGKVSQISYNDTGTVYRFSDPRSRRTYYTYNGFNEVIKQDSPDTGITTFTYDEAGNLATERNEKGQTISYQYDALNRLISMSSDVSGEVPTQYGYDSQSVPNGIGRLTSISDASGTRTFGYTQEGWLSYETWQTAGKTFTTSYQYDTFGNITQITYPSGAVVNYSRTMLGDTTAVTRNYDTVVNQVSRAPYGAITQMQHGNGLSEVRALDLNYRTTSVTVPNVLGVTYNYSPDSLISSVDDIFDAYAADIYGYDLVGRLTSADNLGYSYDVAGNRTYRSENGINERYYISSMSNQLIKVGSVSRQYDDNGNLTQRGADTFSYDSHNRLASATVSGTTAYYQYNHLDQRTSKTLNGQTRLMVYDQQGNLIEELDGITGTTLAQYIWLDGLLVGYVESNQLYHVHNDHLATPKALTDYTGQIAWKATHDPFGKATVQSSGPTLNIRFPGQYFDEETGFHYNWRRYYDPEIGRYITSDPIGLAGGINTYSYALNNPSSFVDPTGEYAVLYAVLAGAFSGAIGGYISGGDLKSTMYGALAGGVVGALISSGSGIPVMLGGNFLASLLGQGLGNHFSGKCIWDMSNYNFYMAAGAALGSSMSMPASIISTRYLGYFQMNVIGRGLKEKTQIYAHQTAFIAAGEGVGVGLGEQSPKFLDTMYRRVVDKLRQVEVWFKNEDE